MEYKHINVHFEERNKTKDISNTINTEVLGYKYREHPGFWLEFELRKYLKNNISGTNNFLFYYYCLDKCFLNLAHQAEENCIEIFC